MKNNKLLRAKAILAENDLSIPDEIILRILADTKNETATAYERGDFVMFLYGMGEMGFGTVIGLNHNGYTVQPYFNGRPEGSGHHVGTGDMRGLSTLEEAAEYERERNS